MQAWEPLGAAGPKSLVPAPPAPRWPALLASRAPLGRAG